MSHSFPKHILDKAHDISFAVFRVAAIVKNMKLRMALEDAAVELVSDTAAAVDKLGALIKLGASVTEIRPVNAEVLYRELDKLSSAIQSVIHESAIGNDEEVDLEEVFAELACGEPVEPNSATSGNEEKNEEISPHIVNRQSAILEFIRQLPNGCRMRDLTGRFPEVSERTIRNDLQALLGERLIERAGKGPFSSFRAVTKQEIIAL